MRVTTGTVVGGHVVIEGEPLVEGAKVTVLFQEDGETFEASSDEEATLLQSIAEADRGDLVDFKDVLAGLGKQH